MKVPVDRLMLGEARLECAELRAECERLRTCFSACEVATLRDKLEVARAERDAVHDLLNQARSSLAAECAALRAELDKAECYRVAAESRLAAATELLLEWVTEEQSQTSVFQRSKAFLAAQPAQPKKDGEP